MPENGELTTEQMHDVIGVIKEAILYKVLLNDFERNVVDDTIMRYRKFGMKMRMSTKQLELIGEIEEKLFLI